MGGTSESELESTVTEGEDLGGNQSNHPSPNPRTSLLVRFSDPNNLNSEMDIAKQSLIENWTRLNSNGYSFVIIGILGIYKI